MKFFCRAVTYSVYKKWRKPDLKKEAKSLFSMLSKLGNKLLLLLQGNSLYFPTLYVFQLFFSSITNKALLESTASLHKAPQTYRDCRPHF